MYRCKPFSLVIIGICTLNGCGLIHELKDDPAIVGVTGFNLIAGIDPAINSPFPAPKVHMNWGTMFRVGPHDCVYISTAGGASAYTKPLPNWIQQHLPHQPKRSKKRQLTPKIKLHPPRMRQIPLIKILAIPLRNKPLRTQNKLQMKQMPQSKLCKTLSQLKP